MMWDQVPAAYALSSGVIGQLWLVPTASAASLPAGYGRGPNERL